MGFWYINQFASYHIKSRKYIVYPFHFLSPPLQSSCTLKTQSFKRICVVSFAVCYFQSKFNYIWVQGKDNKIAKQKTSFNSLSSITIVRLGSNNGSNRYKITNRKYMFLIGLCIAVNKQTRRERTIVWLHQQQQQHQQQHISPTPI